MNDEVNLDKRSVASPGFGRVGFLVLTILVHVQLALYVWLQRLSGSFAYGSDTLQRPIVLIAVLLSILFVLSMIALAVALRGQSGRGLMYLILAAAVAFRCIMLFSLPIQEVDIYRYIWDGAVLSEGVSPFRFSPKTVLDTHETTNPQLVKLVSRRDRDQGLATALRRVHYGELTTVYPLTSQVVFAAADRITPEGASATNRRRIMKAIVVAFDLATAAVLAALLSHCGMHFAWLIPYAWSPLLVKEFANSGHLDSIAVFWTALAVLLLVKSLPARQCRLEEKPAPAVGRPSAKTGRGLAVASAVALGLAVGAKIFPVVLIPLWGLVLTRRISFWFATCVVVLTLFVSVALVGPLLIGAEDSLADSSPTNQFDQMEPVQQDTPPLPSLTSSSENEAPNGEHGDALDASFSVAVAELDWPAVASPVDEFSQPSGIAAFVSRWQMNDLLFMIVEENVKPAEATSDPIWFSVVPESWRTWILDRLEEWMGRPVSAFTLARILTSVTFLLLALYFAWRASAATETAVVLEYAFLTLAWFWLLSPTQNPWYWSWALALIPFARNRVWLLMGAVVVVYYLRFWFAAHFAGLPVLGTELKGEKFFDYVIVWWEFGPLLVLLFFNWLRLRGGLNRLLSWGLHGWRQRPAV